MAQRKIKKSEARNVLFVSIHLMITKALQTTASAALLVDLEKTSEDKDPKTHKKSYCVRSWLQRKEKKGCHFKEF